MPFRADSACERKAGFVEVGFLMGKWLISEVVGRMAPFCIGVAQVLLRAARRLCCPRAFGGVRLAQDFMLVALLLSLLLVVLVTLQAIAFQAYSLSSQPAPQQTLVAR